MPRRFRLLWAVPDSVVDPDWVELYSDDLQRIEGPRSTLA